MKYSNTFGIMFIIGMIMSITFLMKAIFMMIDGRGKEQMSLFWSIWLVTAMVLKIVSLLYFVWQIIKTIKATKP